MTTVKVGAYRNEIDHLFRLANVDYHACVGVREVESWKAIAERVLGEAEVLECTRATVHDREQFGKAIAALKARVLEAETHIAHLQVPSKAASRPQTPAGIHTPPQMASLTAERFEKWARVHKPLATTLRTARQFAQTERQRVDAYVLPIFQSFEFRDEEGQPIQQPRDLYLCPDEAMCTAFYSMCDLAHRSHGFTGPEGHCPALTAETAVIARENVLLIAGSNFLGFASMPSALFGRDARKQMLDLLMKACLGEEYTHE